MEMRRFSGGDAVAVLGDVRQQYSENRATRRRQEQLRRKLEKASKKAVQKQPQPGPAEDVYRVTMPRRTYAFEDGYLYSYTTTCTKAGLGS